MLSVERVRKKYGAVAVLDGVSFDVPPGQVAAIVGRNGCGKSTLLAVMAAMLRPDSGRVLLDGQDPLANANLRRRIGYVAQGDSLFEELSVADNLRFWAGAAGIAQADTQRSPFVELLELDGFWRQRVSRLSGGMRRRVAICAALLADPQYILLDEPFSGLDMVYRQQLGQFLLELRAQGKTIVYTTHSPQELADLSDFALLLSGGQIARTLTAAELCEADLEQLFLHLIEGGASE